MDRTPKSKFARYNPSTATKEKRFWDYDIDSSQEINDVMWDWDSPKNIKPKAVRVKKREVHKSPISAPKKTSQTDHMKNYERLKQELQALRDEIARTDDCVPLSPVDEQIFKEESAYSEINSFIEEQYLHIENQEIEAKVKKSSNQCNNETVDELFDDDCDEQLLLCTQMIEDEISANNAVNEESKNENIKNNKSDMINVFPRKIVNNLEINVGKVHTKSVDDSFDNVLLEFEDEDIILLSQANTSVLCAPNRFQNNKTSNLSFKRTTSDANVQYSSNSTKKLNSFKPDFPRTQSFEATSVMKNKDSLPEHVINEIERKRQEALARLSEKKDKEKKVPNSLTSFGYDNTSVVTCSPDEIEKKRLQAKAIREAKQREIIEKKRLEAMRRLELNKRKKLENSKFNVKNHVC